MKLVLDSFIKNRGNIQAFILPYKHPIEVTMSNIGSVVKDLMQLKDNVLMNTSMVVYTPQEHQRDLLIDKLTDEYPAMNVIILFEDGSVISTTACCSYVIDVGKYTAVTGKELAQKTSSRFVNFLNEPYDVFLVIGSGDIFESLIYHSEDGLDVGITHCMV